MGPIRGTKGVLETTEYYCLMLKENSSEKKNSNYYHLPFINVQHFSRMGTYANFQELI